jgi:ribosomal protein L32
MNLNEALDRVAKGRATVGDIGFVVTELRAAEREKRRSEKALKLLALNDSRIIGKLKRENRKMFEAFCKDCHHRCGWRCVVQTGNKASMITAGRSNCPLLKKVKK